MLNVILFILILTVIIAFILVDNPLTKFRRRHLKHKFFPQYWSFVLEKNIPLYKGLSEGLKKQLQGHIHVFLAEKQFIGCRGLQITDEVRLTIAGQACLLLLNKRSNYYPKLYSILVYPSVFIGKKVTALSGHYLEETQARSGESSGKSGLIVLSWDHVKHDTLNWQDGHNVVLHEFAHQLDQEEGRAEGVPLLPQKSDYITWAQVFGEAYQHLRRKAERGSNTVIHEYGATDPAEFFAVATETFFEQPVQLKSNYPELYQQLKRYYQLDPIEWLERGY
ncbi:MAG: zinc-dependent peptidase [Cyanothece sp. SIO1E1]|nr:zinc-dependent peptidase [Cyanothece sp. SIO1E1]